MVRIHHGPPSSPHPSFLSATSAQKALISQRLGRSLFVRESVGEAAGGRTNPLLLRCNSSPTKKAPGVRALAWRRLGPEAWSSNLGQEPGVKPPNGVTKPGRISDPNRPYRKYRRVVAGQFGAESCLDAICSRPGRARAGTPPLRLVLNRR